MRKNINEEVQITGVRRKVDSRSTSDAGPRSKASRFHRFASIFLSWDMLFQMVIFGVMAASFAPLLNVGMSGLTFGAVESLTDQHYGLAASALLYASSVRVLKSKFVL